MPTEDRRYHAICFLVSFFFSSKRRHTRSTRDWSSDVCSSDLTSRPKGGQQSAVNAEPQLVDGLGVEPRARTHDRARTRRSEERRVGKECKSRRASDS